MLQLLAMGFLLRRAGRMPRWRLPRFGAAIRRMWKKFTVASAGAVVMQVNLIVDLVLASLLPVGAISWLYFADRLAQLPLGVIGIALGTALLPRLSAQLRGGEHKAARQSLADAVQLAAFLVLPAAAALIMIAPQIIAGLFQHGAFTSAAVTASAAALAAYALGMPAHVMVKVLQPAFYAAGRPGFVLGVSVAAVTVNIALSLSLMPVLGHVGLALATSASGLVAAIALAVALARRRNLGLPPAGLLLRIALATMVMAAALALGKGLTEDLSAVVRLVLLIMGGGIAYILAAYALGMPAHVMIKVLQPAFYAAGRPGFVLGVSVAAVTVNIALSLSLMPVLGHVGLALATSASGLVAAIALAVALARRRNLGLPPAGVLLRITLATLVMAAVLALGKGLTQDLSAVVRLVLLITGGGIAYILAAVVAGAVPRHLLRR